MVFLFSISSIKLHLFEDVVGLIYTLWRSVAQTHILKHKERCRRGNGGEDSGDDVTFVVPDSAFHFLHECESRVIRPDRAGDQRRSR